MIAALNLHLRPEGGLIEHPAISYGNWRSNGKPMSGLLLNGVKELGIGTWVASLTEKLLKDEVLRPIDGAGHLRLKPGLTAKERRMVEWLHAGLMNQVYGGLVDKRHYMVPRGCSTIIGNSDQRSARH